MTRDVHDASGFDIGTRLRTARLARNITLDQVEARIKIKRQLLEDLENNNLTSWPVEKFYKESYLRVYAKTVGVEPQEIVDQFRRELQPKENTAGASSSPAPLLRPAKPQHSAWLLPAAAIAVSFVIGVVVGRRDTRRIEMVPERIDASGDARLAASHIRSTEPPVNVAAVPQPQPVPVVPPADVEGELTITSTPPDARVTVNGIARGTTPARVRFLRPGSYTIRIIQDGYPIQERRVSITAEQPRASVRVALRSGS
jgi:transcriptional regulator with XRE-family HTH domain